MNDSYRSNAAPEHKHLAPLVVDTRMLRPLDKARFRSKCSNCGQDQAMWEMGPANEPEKCTFVCSICFLYESKWGEKRRDQIDALADDVEQEKGVRFLRGQDGKQLLACKDADGLLSAIAITSRMFQMQDRLQAVRGGPPKKPSTGEG